MPEFDTLFGAINSYNSDHTVKALFYDDLKRKIVTRQPHHSNYITLADKNNPFNPNLSEEIVVKIAHHHAAQYQENIVYEAERDALSYDDIFDILNIDFRIFYDAALYIRDWICKEPSAFGLQKIMHQTKSLAFIPLKTASPCLTA